MHEAIGVCLDAATARAGRGSCAGASAGAARASRGPEGKRGPQGERGVKGETGRNAADLALLQEHIDRAVRAHCSRPRRSRRSDGGRTLRWAIGETVHEIKTAIVLDAGVWREGTAYVAGDGVTMGGSFFIAQADTSAKPGKSDEWRLAVKRGSDGRDARTERALEPVRFK